MSLSGMTEPKDIQYPKYHHCGFQYEDHWWLELPDGKYGLCPIIDNQALLVAHSCWWVDCAHDPDCDLPEVLWDIENAEQWGR